MGWHASDRNAIAREQSAVSRPWSQETQTLTGHTYGGWHLPDAVWYSAPFWVELSISSHSPLGHQSDSGHEQFDMSPVASIIRKEPPTTGTSRVSAINPLLSVQPALGIPRQERRSTDQRQNRAMGIRWLAVPPCSLVVQGSQPRKDCRLRNIQNDAAFAKTGAIRLSGRQVYQTSGTPSGSPGKSGF